MKLWRPALKLAFIGGVGVAAAVLVANTLSVPVPGKTVEYSAIFSNVEGLTPGNDVTVAGVRVGRVDSVEFVAAGAGRTQALVRFEIQSDKKPSADAAAAIRYGDMLGIRYLALTAPTDGSSGTLAPGSQIPLDRTAPPVDLTALVNGFKPLFDAIDPAQVNDLARSVVDAFQGESAAVSTLLTRIADVTENLNNHQAVFTQLVTNLNGLLGSVNQRGSQVSDLINGLATMSTSVAAHNEQLIGLLDNGSAAVRSLADLMTNEMEPLNQSVVDLDNMTKAWVANTDTFNQTMTELPRLAASVNRIGDYGGWLNLYICNFTLKAGTAEVNIFGPTHSAVCR